ncbi:phage tail tape measure protein [Streptomyces sp. NPDC048696]|uniref:phage tail tape measure protein n=1 Tax=Streptomyces sp. NPDC048696 TaxID=3365585 RepID=UPI003722804C
MPSPRPTRPNLNRGSARKWGAVTGASGVEMVQAGAKARELGADLEIHGTSAAKAADAMLELAKAGQTSTSSIANARAAMQLAAADNLSAADAARFLGDVMDQFGLSSNNSGRAADVLAAGANAASGGLQDIYCAMSYTGPVANQLNVSLEDTASAVALLARSGILGSKAGTSLRGMLTNLAKPTKAMRQGLADLGIEAWDAQGTFKGLRTVIEGFEQAQHRMSQKDFLGALASVVGKPALAGAAALAHQGVAAYDQMHTAIARTGAAEEIAASQTKGLSGAVTQLRTQAKNTGQVLYTATAPAMEKFTRMLTAGMSAATPYLAGAIDYVHDLYTLAEPGLGARACPADHVTSRAPARWHAHGAGRSHERRMGPAEAASAQVREARRALGQPPQNHQRDPLPAAHRRAVAGSACAVR